MFRIKMTGGWESSGQPLALEPVAIYYMSHQHQHIRLFQTSTEDGPVSMSGCLVADDSTSEGLLCRGSRSKDYNINVNVLPYDIWWTS